MDWLCYTVTIVLATTQGPSITEQFGTYEEGTDGSPTWCAFGAEWSVHDSLYEVDTDAFDTGSSLPLFIEDGFSATVELRGPRAGLYFSLDSRDGRACSHMVRFEGKDIMWGYFDGAGVYHATGTAHTASDPDSWRTLAVEVSPVQRTYRVLVDGEVVGENRTLEFRSGYFGLQASYGKSSFRRVALDVSPPVSEEAVPEQRFGHLGLASVDRKGRIVVADRSHDVVLLLGPEAEVIARYGAPACTLRSPGSAAAGPLDRTYVCDTGNSRVVLFEENGTVARVFRFPELRSPVAIEVDRDGGAWIADRASRCIHRVDRWGTLVSSWGQDVLEEPGDLARDKNRLWVSDAVKGVLQVFHSETGELSATHAARFSSPRGLLIHSGRLLVADAGKGTVEVLDEHGNYSGGTDRSPLGPFTCPRGLLELEETVVLIDYDRLVFLPMSEEYEPEVSSPMAGVLRVTWSSMQEGVGEVRYRAKGGIEHTVTEAQAGFRHSIDLDGLAPSRRYRYRLRPTTRVLPPTDVLSWERVMVSPPSRHGVVRYTDLPILVLAYRTVCYRDVYPAHTYPHVPWGRSLSDEELEYLDSCTRRFRDFFWRNSACHLHLDARLAVAEDTLWLSEIGDEDPYWLSPSERVAADVDREAAKLGWHADDVAGVIVSYAWLNHEDHEAGIRITQSVGGGTNVVPAPWQLGQTSGYSGNPFPPGSRQDWLMVHEFHHQLDALLALSGYPEYAHADLPWELEGRFGEDYSFNAAIIRALDPSKWLALEWGSVKEANDRDSDGLPDSDLSLPWDEERLGSNPRRVDTDGDGLSDLAETMMGFFRGTDLLSKDTDQDGKPDLADPSPVWPIDHHRRRLEVSLDGVISPGEWQPLAGLETDQLQGSTYVGWADEELLLAVSLSESASVVWKIDSSGDGWFHGAENTWIRYNPWGGGEHTLEVRAYDSSRWNKAPVFRDDVQPAGQGEVATGVQNGQLVVEVAVPTNPDGSLPLETNSAFYLRTTFLIAGPPRRKVDLFDETEMVRLWLTG